MRYYRIQIPAKHVDLLWDTLSLNGITPLYAEENAEENFLIIDLNHCDLNLLENLALPYKIEDFSLETTNWEQQWITHCPYYKNGKITVPLEEFGSPGKISLVPGSGFGDLSHPTTRLTLSMMDPLVAKKTVVDLGCGSGILSIAALAWGAKHAHAIDIDPEALLHTRANAEINHFRSINCVLPEDLYLPDTEEVILLCNMIELEQKIALKSIEKILPQVSWAVMSGILSEEKEQYLQFANTLNWKLRETKEEEDWIGLLFKKND